MRAQLQQLGNLVYRTVIVISLSSLVIGWFSGFIEVKKNYLRKKRVTHVGCVFDGDAELAQVAAELFDALIVALDGVGRKLLQPAGQPLGFGHLTRPDARPLFVEHVLHLHRENLAKVVVLLRT